MLPLVIPVIPPLPGFAIVLKILLGPETVFIPLTCIPLTVKMSVLFVPLTEYVIVIAFVATDMEAKVILLLAAKKRSQRLR